MKKEGAERFSFEKDAFCSIFLLKKITIIFEKCAIGHILFKFMLYNNCNCEFKKGGVL